VAEPGDCLLHLLAVAAEIALVIRLPPLFNVVTVVV
jgi:hypothetical protein